MISAAALLHSCGASADTPPGSRECLSGESPVETAPGAGPAAWLARCCSSAQTAPAAHCCHPEPCLPAEQPAAHVHQQAEPAMARAGSKQPLLQTDGVCIVRPEVSQRLDVQQLGWRIRASPGIQPDLICSQSGKSVAFLLVDEQAAQPQTMQALRSRHVATRRRPAACIQCTTAAMQAAKQGGAHEPVPA